MTIICKRFIAKVYRFSYGKAVDNLKRNSARDQVRIKIWMKIQN